MLWVGMCTSGTRGLGRWTKETFRVIYVCIYITCVGMCPLRARVTRGTIGARGTFVALCLCILCVGMLPLGARGTKGNFGVICVCICSFFFYRNLRTILIPEIQPTLYFFGTFLFFRDKKVSMRKK